MMSCLLNKHTPLTCDAWELVVLVIFIGTERVQYAAPIPESESLTSYNEMFGSSCSMFVNLFDDCDLFAGLNCEKMAPIDGESKDRALGSSHHDSLFRLLVFRLWVGFVFVFEFGVRGSGSGSGFYSCVGASG